MEPAVLTATRLGPYRLREQLGAGAMGAVYLAEADEGPVALKVIHPHLLEQSGYFKRFQREAEAGRRVEHPNVVRTLDSDLLMAGGQPCFFLVMEYVQGRTLRELLREMGVLPEALVREIGRQVAAGLAAIHAAGIVHRDLKPENVLITDDHRVRIMDLGVARVEGATTHLTLAGQFAGSLLYAAPEQFRDDVVGPSADLYALGVLLYELVAGANPFRHDVVAAVMRAHLEEEPPRLEEVEPEVSLFLAELVHTLLQTLPEARFPHAESVQAALEQTAVLTAQRCQTRCPSCPVGRAGGRRETTYFPAAAGPRTP